MLKRAHLTHIKAISKQPQALLSNRIFKSTGMNKRNTLTGVGFHRMDDINRIIKEFWDKGIDFRYEFIL
jgi:hypothetical protein